LISKIGNPLFSIIIPTCNRAELLEKAIRSVQGQTCASWELLVVDDASTDHTAELVSSLNDSRIRYFYQNKSERSKARNKGIENALGKYICFLDDDDFLKKSFLSDFKTAIPSNPDTIFRTGFDYKFMQDHRVKPGKLIGPHQHPFHFALEEMCGVWSLCIPRVCLKQDKFADFPHWQDTHLILRLFAKYPVVQLNSRNYVYTQHPAMGTKKIFTDNREIEKRLTLNLAAIRDLFNHYSSEFQEFITPNTEKILISGKILHYAIITATRNNPQKAWDLFMRSLKTGLFLQHYKLYMVFLKKYLFIRWKK